MVKKTNTRITITISKKQYKWLNDLCNEKHMKMSNLIAWLLYQKSIDVEHTRQLLDHPDEAINQIEKLTEDETNKIWDEAMRVLGYSENEIKNRPNR